MLKEAITRMDSSEGSSGCGQPVPDVSNLAQTVEECRQTVKRKVFNV